MIIIPFSPDMIIGSGLIVLGISYILKALFNIDIPLVKVFLGAFLIFWGISMFIDIKFAPSQHLKKTKKNNLRDFDSEINEKK